MSKYKDAAASDQGSTKTTPKGSPESALPLGSAGRWWRPSPLGFRNSCLLPRGVLPRDHPDGLPTQESPSESASQRTPPLQPQPFSDTKILHFMPLLSVVFVFSSSQIQLHTQPLQSEGLCYSSSKTCLKILSPLLSYKWLHLPQPNSYSNFIIKAQIQSHCKIPPP